ncbi:hypothetical protein LCGC14_0718680 [marine sediment metagenome]|uniref:Uncharacterized protein n=1 Tax=marine sediment metagenome TaxID=412755 RepID=A0A0F9TKI3_9ZZZZ
MIEKSRIIDKIVFLCNDCYNPLKNDDIYEFLDIHLDIIRKRHDDSIKEMVIEDQFVEDPYEHPVYGKIDYKCPECNENLLIKILMSAYDSNLVSFYDIEGTNPFLPFQVLKGREIKELILEFMFRWVHIAKWIDIVTPYIDDFGYKFLRKLPDFIYYYNPGIFINLITSYGSNEKKRGGKAIYGKSGKKLIDQVFKEEDCKNCILKNPNISYGDCLGCIKLSNHINLRIPNIPWSYFHAKWYSGILEDKVEIMISSHNLTKTGKDQPETIGLLIIEKLDYSRKFLSKLKV